MIKVTKATPDDMYDVANLIIGSFGDETKEHRSGKTGLLLYNKLMDWFKDMDVDKIQMMHYSWNPKVGDFYKRKVFVPFELSYIKSMKED